MDVETTTVKIQQEIGRIESLLEGEDKRSRKSARHSLLLMTTIVAIVFLFILVNTSYLRGEFTEEKFGVGSEIAVRPGDFGDQSRTSDFVTGSINTRFGTGVELGGSVADRLAHARPDLHASALDGALDLVLQMVRLFRLPLPIPASNSLALRSI